MKNRVNKNSVIAVLSTFAFSTLISPAHADTTITGSTLSGGLQVNAPSNLNVEGGTQINGNVGINAPATIGGSATNAFDNALTDVHPSDPSSLIQFNVPVQNVIVSGDANISGTGNIGNLMKKPGVNHLNLQGVNAGRTAVIAIDLAAPTDLKIGSKTTGVITGYTLQGGETFDVSCSDENVLTIDGTLTVAAKKAGTAVVVVKVKNGSNEVIKQGAVSVRVAAADNTGAAQSVQVTSSAFAANGSIPIKYGFNRDGSNLPEAKNTSLPFSWSKPAGTQSFALVMYDPDAQNFVHWAVVNLPASTTSLPEGASMNLDIMPLGSSIELNNGFGIQGYGGPQPPSGTHHYKTVVYALNAPTVNLNSDGHYSFDDIQAALAGKIIAQGELTGTYTPFPAPVAQPGYEVNSTKIMHTTGAGNKLKTIVQPGPFTAPAPGTPVPNGAQDYTAGMELFHVSVGQHVGLYEVDDSNNIVHFFDILLTPANVAAPAPALTGYTVGQGSVAGSTKITYAPTTGGSLKVVTSPISGGLYPTTPISGADEFSGKPYRSGDDITGVSAGWWVRLYEVDGNNKIVKYVDIQLMDGDVNPGIANYTQPPSAANITVHNNNEPMKDYVEVTGLTTGDVINVYSDPSGTAQYRLGSATVGNGETSAEVSIPQLGTGSGTVYVTLTNSGKSESEVTPKAYDAEFAPPANVTVSTSDTQPAAIGGVQNVVQWTDSASPSVQNYTIYRANSGNPSDAQFIGGYINPGVRSYTDDTAIPGTPYDYYVYASDGNQTFSRSSSFNIVTAADAPAVTDAVLTSADTILLTFSSSLTGSAGNPAAFIIHGAASSPDVINVAVSGDTVTLTLNNNITFGDTITVDYTPKGTNDLTNGTLVAAFVGRPVRGIIL
ncbi:YbhB/YbcL family Raf kinase inhibitor-like protein [Aneurinibacillus terranovensis]|uniref:YbhB/YbcL family Raf kinase inhibitor-like protein n=1 Tax=Aneurinibacillus terranovensis TaxID=278991 RepID=UPI000687F3E3|nr:YbhB/YbcL family Raf kinase inhibitor-like protein [Aneurinibacillus terranovensis]